ISLSNNVKLLAQYTGATYCSDDTKLLAWDCPFHCKVLTPDSETIAILYNKELDVKGTLIKNTKYEFLVLAFRGSNSKVNWELNGKDTLVPINLGKLNSTSCPNIKVHQGFQEATIGLRQYYCDSISKLYDQNPNLKSWPLFVVGHSLGGSIANLASVDLIYNLGLKNIKVYTFGQPRVGNKDFVQLTSSVIKTYIRAINGNDPVPILASSLKGYLHGPTEVHYLANVET
ncbi:alpha/beta-hydrolase, partial [Neoconidiobolus thromboides FSU 785]